MSKRITILVGKSDGSEPDDHDLQWAAEQAGAGIVDEENEGSDAAAGGVALWWECTVEKEAT